MPPKVVEFLHHLIRSKLNWQAEPVSSGPDASGTAAFDLPGYFRLHCAGRSATAEARAPNRESRLLRENENGIGGARVRPARTEVGPGQGMLRALRPWLRTFRHLRHAVRLSAGRRRNFCRLHFFRAQPLATSSGSAAAPLILPDRDGSPPRLRGQRNGTQQEDSNEIPISDCSGPGAGRHSERDFAFG